MFNCVSLYTGMDDDDEPCGLVIPSNRESPGEGEWIFWARRDAWIPSERIREALKSRAIVTPGSSSPEGELTMPGISPDGRSMGEAETYILSRETKEALKRVTHDIAGLRQLIQGEQYRAAVILIDNLLTDFGQGVSRAGKRSRHSVNSIQLWFARLTMLIKLGKTDIAETESAVWWDCDRPDLYYQFYPMRYGGRLGTMVPFQMRLLLALLPAHFGRHIETVKRLFSILDTVVEIKKNLDNGLCEDGSNLRMCPSDRAKSKKLWNTREHRILMAIVNIAVEIKDFRLSTNALKQIIMSQPSSALQRILYATLARYSLQFDDNQGGKESFDQAGSTILTLGLLGTGGTDFEYLVERGQAAMSKLIVNSLNAKENNVNIRKQLDGEAKNDRARSIFQSKGVENKGSVKPSAPESCAAGQSCDSRGSDSSGRVNDPEKVLDEGEVPVSPLSYPFGAVQPPPGFTLRDAFIPYSPYNIHPMQHIFPMNHPPGPYIPRPPPGCGPLPDPMSNMGTMPHPYHSLNYQAEYMNAFPFMYPPMTLNASQPTCPPYGHLPPQGCNAPNLPTPPPPQQSELGAEPSKNNNDA